jgi:2,4-dienoyl-CoA reductase (NADPH2)
VHRAVLQRNGVEMLAGVEYQNIDDAGLHIHVNGAPRVLAVDHIVLCAGQEPLAELMPDAAAQAQTGAATFHRIGGAALATELDAKRAIREGAVLAASL